MKFNNSPEHRFFPVPFTVLTLCGIWYPENWPTKAKRIYKCFSVLLVIFGALLFIEVFTNVILTTGTDKFNLENVFAVNVFSVGLYKKVIILLYRKKILNFIRDYKSHKWHKPQSSMEAIINKQIQSETRRTSLMYAIFIGIAIFLRTITPVLEFSTFKVLPLEAWYPYSVDNFFSFWLTYLHQIISGVTLTCMHLCADTLYVGFLLQMNYQLNILKHRLREFGNPDENKRVRNCKENNQLIIKTTIVLRAQEHEYIYRFGQYMQKIFEPLTMGQMVVLVPNLIINTYYLSVHTDRINLKYLMTLFFALVPMMQIYMFCWYANEAILGSSELGDALYQCNWINLDQPTKKILLTIITRTSKPIVISAGAAIPLNLGTYLSIIKISYSAFNLLQKTTTD